jgi:MOSC domain-containing protein YiiM
MHEELFSEVAMAGYVVEPGQLGENITTRGIDLLNLPSGTLLRIGDDAVVRLTGLRNPCQQINEFEPGLLREVLACGESGAVERRSGIMAVVVAGGVVRPEDSISVSLPVGARLPLVPV